jgi:hypothetical protein
MARIVMSRPSKLLVILFGPPAVGKMAVGRELAHMTGLRLFHNHMALEPVLEIFPYGSDPFNRIVRSFRDSVFQEAARSDLPGLIYTSLWDLDDMEAKEYIDQVVELFEANGALVHFVELSASLEVRLDRNRSDLRLTEKPSKRDVEASEARLLANEKRRLNTTGSFFYPDRHVRLDTSDMTTREVAHSIARTLGLLAEGTTEST